MVLLGTQSPKEVFKKKKKKPEVETNYTSDTPQLQGGTYQGGTMNRKEFEAYKSALGFSGSGMLTEGVKGALSQTKGTREFNQAQAQQQQTEAQMLGQEIQGKPMVTQQDIEEAVPQTPFLDQSTALGAGVATAGATALGTAALTAKLGAMAGTAIAPGIGTAIGAGAGLIAGIGAYYTKISFSKRGDVKQAKKVADIANRNFGQTIDALNAGLITRDVALKRFKEDKTSLYAAHANLKRDTNSQLDKWLSGGADELAQIDDYIQDLNQIYENEFILALAAPDSNRIRYYNPNQGVTEE